jgi:type I restriction enzyme S subunit
MMENETLPSLPDGWVWTKLGDITDVMSGYGFPKKYQGKTNNEIPFFKVGDISKAVLNGNIFLKVVNNYISEKECKEIRAKQFKKGTIVFAKIGEALKLNRRAILTQNSIVDNNVMGIYPSSGILGKFTFYFFMTIKLEDYCRATTVPSVRKSDVEQISVPLPPLPEQHRIVARIEQLFTNLDAGVESRRWPAPS